jgi:hypothetical protein
LQGDYNGDGKVDAADYVAWRKTNGTLTGYDTWRENFGRSSFASAAVASAAVPEPPARLMFLLGLTAVPFSPRRIRNT